jgi:hypothetical protein
MLPPGELRNKAATGRPGEQGQLYSQEPISGARIILIRLDVLSERLGLHRGRRCLAGLRACAYRSYRD